MVIDYKFYRIFCSSMLTIASSPPVQHEVIILYIRKENYNVLVLSQRYDIHFVHKWLTWLNTFSFIHIILFRLLIWKNITFLVCRTKFVQQFLPVGPGFL